MRRIYAIIAIAVSCLVMTTCKKDKEPDPPVFKFNEVEASGNSAKITGEYEYGGELKNLTLLYGKDPQLVDAGKKDVEVDGRLFSVTVDDLESETKYYYGIECKTTYSLIRTETESFMTKKTVSMAEVTTNEVTAVATSTATCGGTVTSDGNAAVTARGVCWSTSPYPTPEEDSFTEDGTGTGSFVSYISGLTENTKYYVRAYATNEKGTSYGEQKEFTTLSSEGLPTVTTNEVTDITTNSATSGGNVTSDGNASVTAKGICWSTTPNPTVANEHTEDGTGTGSFVSYMTGLNHGTKYYVRAYATNRAGTAYGEQKEFTTEVNEELPIVTTNEITGITQTTATSGGNVTSDGNATVTARGVCWSTSQNPTISNSHTTDGNGTGSFTSNMTGLTANTTYYVRAYATNSAGTGYGEQRSFTTLQNIELPTVTTTNVSNITQTTATSGGNVTSDGGTTITARGVCWSTSQNPTISNSHTTDGNGTGSFTSNMTGLTANTTYYVRAYATNSAGTGYGDVVSFTTLEEENGGIINGHEYVDLGLPSGLKWATCNVGADSPEDYGNYYAWGETTTKAEYTSGNSLTDGLSISDLLSQGIIGGDHNLTPSHDAATANWGGSWRMPTADEIQELLDECTWTWTTQNGVNGYKVTGPNGNHIFLPAAGFRSGSSLYYAGEDGSYWSSTPYESDSSRAYYLYFLSDNQYVYCFDRGDGRSVRPVAE